MKKQLLMHSGESFHLTGLGVLVFPLHPAPLLAQFELHSALLLALHWPTGQQETATGSVEEVTRPGASASEGSTETRALLLTHEEAALLPSGTEIWWSGEVAGW